MTPYPQVGANICFLCGTELGAADARTREHVIPAWVQRRFRLGHERLNLLNGTNIPYRQLTIPCCRLCNGVHLSKVERRIQDMVNDPDEAVSHLDEQAAFIWLGKIFYGILYKEGLLPVDRTSPDDSPIVPPELLERYHMHHRFLQSVRTGLKFVDFFPASIFAFKMQVPDHVELQYDMRDSPPLMTIAIRLGPLAFIAALQDGGAQRALYADALAEYQQLTLHPLQFHELVAKFFYRASLFNRTTKYLTDQRNNTVYQLPLGGLSTKPVYDDWDQREYADILSLITGYPLDMIHQPPSMVMTWLHHPDGQLRHIDWTDAPTVGGGLEGRPE